DRKPIDSWTGVALQPPESSAHRLHIDMVQQGCEPRPTILASYLADPREVGRQGDPALRPDPGLLTRVLPGPGPSLRHLATFHGFSGTMNRSDCRRRLDEALRLPLAFRPLR